jgi:hypothetical protein
MWSDDMDLTLQYWEDEDDIAETIVPDMQVDIPREKNRRWKQKTHSAFDMSLNASGAFLAWGDITSSDVFVPASEVVAKLQEYYRELKVAMLPRHQARPFTKPEVRTLLELMGFPQRERIYRQKGDNCNQLLEMMMIRTAGFRSTFLRRCAMICALRHLPVKNPS